MSGDVSTNLVGDYEIISDDAAINAISWHITNCIMRRQTQTGASTLPSPDKIYNDLVTSQIQKSSSGIFPSSTKDIIYKACPLIMNLLSKPYMQNILSRAGLFWFVANVEKNFTVQRGMIIFAIL